MYIYIIDFSHLTSIFFSHFIFRRAHHRSFSSSSSFTSLISRIREEEEKTHIQRWSIILLSQFTALTKNSPFQVKLEMRLSNGFVKLLLQSREKEKTIFNDRLRSALDRYMDKYADHTIPHKFSARRTCDRSLLGLDDRIKFALDDAESVVIGKITLAISFRFRMIDLGVGKRYYDDDSFSTAT